jgi:hypothetical protein
MSSETVKSGLNGRRRHRFPRLSEVQIGLEGTLQEKLLLARVPYIKILGFM